MGLSWVASRSGKPLHSYRKSASFWSHLTLSSRCSHASHNSSHRHHPTDGVYDHHTEPLPHCSLWCLFNCNWPTSSSSHDSEAHTNWNENRAEHMATLAQIWVTLGAHICEPSLQIVANLSYAPPSAIRGPTSDLSLWATSTTNTAYFNATFDVIPLLD